MNGHLVVGGGGEDERTSCSGGKMNGQVFQTCKFACIFLLQGSSHS